MFPSQALQGHTFAKTSTLVNFSLSIVKMWAKRKIPHLLDFSTRGTMPVKFFKKLLRLFLFRG